MNMDERLEAAMGDFFWLPEHVEIVDRAELKYVCAPEQNALFNHVVRARLRGGAIPSAVEEVLRAHQGRISRWTLAAPSCSDELVAALERAGYEAEEHIHHGYTCATNAYDRTPPEDVVCARVEDIEQLRALHRVQHQVFGDPTQPLTDADVARELADCERVDARVARFIAKIEGEAVGAAGVTLFPEHDIAFLWAGGVREAYRGRGVYTALLAARIDHVRARGISTVGLYARTTTSGPIVQAHGFEQHGVMRAWVKAP